MISFLWVNKKRIDLVNMQKEVLLGDLIEKTENVVECIKEWKACSDTTLNQRPADGGWSVFQCVEHLNLYSEHYVPALEQYSMCSNLQKSGVYTSGWLWGRFANTMLLDSSRLRIQTFRDKEPSCDSLDKDVFEVFLAYQDRLMKVLRAGVDLDLDKRYVPLSLSSLFKMKLGDGLCLQVYHNERHIKQAKRVLKSIANDSLG